MRDKKVKGANKGKPDIAVGIGILIFGVAGAILMWFYLIDELEFMKSAVGHSATISRIDSHSNGVGMDKEVIYTAYVKYVVDNKEYERHLRTYNSRMYVGKAVKIYYDPNNPGDISPGFTASLTVGLGLFSLVGLIGAVLIVSELRRHSLKRILLRFGIVVEAEFDGVLLSGVQVGDESQYFIQCKWIDSAGKTHLLKSERLSFDPKPVIEEKRIKTFSVYMDPRNPKRYYIPMEELS